MICLICISSILTKRQLFLIYLLSRQAFLITIVSFVQYFNPTFFKGPAKFLYDRSYNNYNKEQFKNVLKRRLVSASNFEVFFDTFLATLNEHTPLKKKKKLYSHQVFMSKTRRMAIMKRSKLREVHLTRKDLLKTCKIISDIVISVRIY